MDVDEKEYKLKPILLITVIAVALGTNFGIYNSSVVNNLEPNVIEYINQTGLGSWISSDKNTVWAVFVSAFTAGTAIGTVFSPFLADYMGRKRGLILSASFNVAGGVLCGFYLHIFELSLVGRLLQGISLGTGLPLAASFVTEISPIKYRGKFNALLQSAFGLGDLCGMLFATNSILGTLERSNLCLAVTLIPAAVQIVVLIFSYDTPRHLVLKQRKIAKGKKALQYYQGKVASIAAMNEILAEKGVPEMKHSENDDEHLTCSNFCSSDAKKPIILASLLLTTLAFTEISPVMAFSTNAFNSNNFPGNAEMWTVTLGICNFIGSFIALGLMEKLGRKKLFTIGLFGCFGSVVLYTTFSCFITYMNASPYLGYGLVVALDFFLLFYSCIGASGNTLAAEICSQKIRAVAVSSANFCLMAFSTGLIYVYAPISNGLGHPWVFLPSSIISVVLGSYLIYAVPETAGKSLSEIKHQFAKKKQNY